ncbi:MAG: DUF1328 domain-containing protein [Ignavibacteriae bacterium]|nr:DUF1328 domain-containing protein [Ignavibacteriota bacterium]
MARWGILLLGVVIITGILGFAGFADHDVATTARILFYAFLLFLIVALVMGLFGARRVKSRFTSNK